MPIQIQEARVTDELRRAFKFVGRLAPRLDETISPVVVVAGLELGAPPGIVRSAVAEGNQAAVVGQFGSFRFETPPNTLARIDALTFATTTAQMIGVAFGSQLAAPPTNVPPQFTDGRLRGSNAFPAPNSPAGRMFRGAQAGAITVRFRFHSPAAPDARRYQLTNWYVGGLATFDFLEFQAFVANEAFRVNVEWTEWTGVTTVL